MLGKDRHSKQLIIGANFDSFEHSGSMRKALGTMANDCGTERNDWHDGLNRCGMYYKGFVDGEKVAKCLENHRRDTASTFGTISRRHSSNSDRECKLCFNTIIKKN